MSKAAMKQQEAFSYDPFSVEVMRNPLPFYRVLRDRYPAYFMEQYNAWAFSRFADVLSIFQNDDSFHSAEGTLGSREQLSTFHKGAAPKWRRDPLPLLGFNEPGVYQDLRQAMVTQLRPRSVAALEADIRARTRALLDRLLPQGRFDVTKDFAGIVAAGSVCGMCGIPSEKAAEVLAAANLASSQDPVTGGFPPNWEQNRENLLEICRVAIRRHIENGPGGSVPAIDNLLKLQVHGRSITVNEIATLISSILLGGSETLPKVFAHGLMELERNPDQKAEVLGDLENRTGPAFEEMLRLCGPAQWFMRTVRVPVTIGGQKLEVGERVIALIQSGNRDEREFAEPDRFIWNRKIVRHLGFGHGLHFCIGTHLARLEGKIMLQEFLARVPEYTFESTIRTPSSFQWGYTSATVAVPTIGVAA